MTYTYVFLFGCVASLGLFSSALILLGTTLGSERVRQIVGAVVFFAFLLGIMPAFGAFQRRVNRARTVHVDVGSESLAVNTKPGAVFSFGDAQLGPWTLAGYGGMTKGMALHLRSGRSRFVLGGRDHRIDAGTSMEAPPVDSVDATMSASEFDELLTMVGRPPGLDESGPVPGQTIRCLLTPNPARMYSSSFSGMFKNTATALRLNAKPPQPSLAIDVGEDAISLIDLKRDARTASAPIAQVKATPAESTRSVPSMGSLTTAVLLVQVAGARPLTIGCPDWAGPATTTWGGSTKMSYRFAWRGEARPVQEPAFVVSDPDWLTLVEKFGLASRMEDRAPQPGAVTTPGGTPLARPKRKLWIYAVIIAVIMFVVVAAIMTFAFNTIDDRQSKDDQLKADKERQFALPFADLRLPHGVAVDGAGNVYVADGHANRVLKLTAGSSNQIVLPFTGLDLFDGGVINDSIASVAVDAAGNVYVTDTGHNRVVKLAAGSGTQTVLPFRGLNVPEGVAVDSAGTVYVVDYFLGRVLKLAADSSSQTTLPPTGRWGSPVGDVAVDMAGNVYVSAVKSHYRGRSDRYLLKLAAGSDTWTALPPAASGRFVAVDAAGNVYVIAGGVLKLAPGSDHWTQLPGLPPFIDPLSLAVDPRGNNVYVTDHLGSRGAGGGSFFGMSHPKDDAQGFVLKLPAG